jgi:methionyl-tRNA formyltransferase
LPIDPEDSTASLHDKVAALGARMVVEALALAAGRGLEAVKQPTEGVTYAHKIDKHEAAIRWSDDAASICRRVRAFNPFPGASAVLKGETVKVWRAVSGPTFGAAAAGTVLSVDASGIAVATKDSSVLLQELQRPGGKRLAVADFLRGFNVQPGMQFDVAVADHDASAA